MTMTQSLPKLGPYTLLRMVKQDSWGILYTGKEEKTGKSLLLRAIAPELSNQTNFIVRYELLRSTLPQIQHSHLFGPLSLALHQNVCVLAKELPPQCSFEELETLEVAIQKNSIKPQQVPSLLQEIAEGLDYLESFRDHYFQKGIFHDTLNPQSIYLYREPALIGGGHQHHGLIDGYIEKFLFFGDEPESDLLHKIYSPLQDWLHSPSTTSPSLFQHESFSPPSSRRNQAHTSPSHLYTFGVLSYWLFSQKLPRGVYPPLSQLLPSLTPGWDEWVDNCLSSPEWGEKSSMKHALDTLIQLRKESEAASPSHLPPKMTPPPGMTLISVEEKVELGAENGPRAEQPRFRASLYPFFMDITPVTCEQFSQFLPSYQPSTLSKGPHHPATQISWHMAKAYCKWRSEQEGLPPETYRLPTEYEWEAACRGWEGELYPWGAHFEPKRLWCGHTRERGTQEVRALPPGRFGLYGMLGNVWEWTESLFKPHPFSSHQEAGYGKGLKVTKGGCWVTPHQSCRGSLRAAFPPNERRANIGFRCVRIANPHE